LDALSAAGRVSLVHVSAELEDEALRWLRQHDERPYSLDDATSFLVMRRHGLTEALAFDGDFLGRRLRGAAQMTVQSPVAG
jgi:predicted nucleic acid-binding protein